MGIRPIVTEDKDEVVVLKACNEAKKLVEYFEAKRYLVGNTATYNIPLKTGVTIICQTTTFTVENFNKDEFSIDISVAIDFEGNARLWTTDSFSRKIWTTNDTISHSRVDKRKLFLYFAKHHLTNNDDNMSELTCDDIVDIETQLFSR